MAHLLLKGSPSVAGLARPRREALRTDCVLATQPKRRLHQDLSTRAASFDSVLLDELIVSNPQRPGLLEKVAATVAAPCVWYNSALERHPLLTKCCTALFGFAVGDLLAQHFSGVDVNILRALRLGAYGFAIEGPIGSMWYDLLDRHVFPEDAHSVKAVLAKTALDQLVYASVMTAIYFVSTNCIEGHPEQAIHALQTKYFSTLLANYMVWPAAHTINFAFVPTDYRLLYNNAVAIAWLTFLSLASHSSC